MFPPRGERPWSRAARARTSENRLSGRVGDERRGGARSDSGAACARLLRYARDVAYERPVQQSPRDVLLVLRIVHAALITSVVVYGGVVMLVTRPPPPGTVVADAPVARTDLPPSFTAVLAGLALVTLAVIVVVRRKIRPGRYAAPAIASWALAESIAVLGLLLGLLRRDMAYFVPFGAVSLIVMLLLTPRRRDLDLLAPPG